MDEDPASVVLPAKVPAAAGKKKTDHSAKQTINKTEKENKSSVLNKNNAQHKVASSTAGQKYGIKSITTSGVNDSRTRQNTRHNAGTTNYSNAAEYNNELPQRQIRDRDSKGPLPRFRNNEKSGKREFDRQSGSDKTGKNKLIS